MRRALLLILVLASSLAAQNRKIRPRPTKATAACGREVGWRTDIDQALEEAGRSQRPVFWYVPTVRGSRMDRKPEIDHYMMAGPFSDPTLATLLARRFIPVRQRAAGEAQKRYGLVHGSFIEPGFLVLAADGKELLRLDKLTTLNAEWLTWQVRRVLDEPGTASAPSSEVAAARASGDSLALARELLAEGDVTGAAAALGAPAADAAAHLLHARVSIAQRDVAAAEKHLEAARKDARLGGLADLEEAWLRTRQDRPAQALPFFEAARKLPGERGNEARFMAAACRWLTGGHDAARDAWKKLGALSPGDRWTHKASAEAQRLGPFERCFERFDWIPREAFKQGADGTRLPRTKKDIPGIVRRSVRLLLRTQNGSGVWNDSNYDFGGTDSLPNVYVAGTALAARALLEYPEVAGKQGADAVRRAFDFVSNEKHLAWDDVDEIVWAHAYRLYFYEKLIDSGHPLAGRAKKKAREVVRFLSNSQQKTGAWRHEYPNPFVTATVAMCLDRIRSAGIPVGKQMLGQAGASLMLCRSDNGSFSYGMPRRTRRRRGGSLEGSAGRMPVCELGLLVSGQSDQKRLLQAIESSFKYHHLLEKIRKYDDHSDRYGNGGFFFWHDLLGRGEAILRIEDPQKRAALKKQQLDLILQIPEIDGGFVDSHELGKTYGTAMGLMCLKLLLPDNP